jgi:dihydrofolate reductase
MSRVGNLVVQEFVSADGFAANDNNEFDMYSSVSDWSLFDRSNLSWISSAGGILLGAKTYEEFVRYWPSPDASEELLAGAINALPKHVFSRTRTEAAWGDFAPAIVESGDTAATVTRLKKQHQGDLIVWGSLSLVATLIELGMVDSIRLVVLPIAIGAGQSVFPRGERNLSLVRCTEFPGGVVELEYSIEPAVEDL